MKQPKFVLKRDGRTMSFDKKYITDAINQAFTASNEGNAHIAKKMTKSVVLQIIRSHPHSIPAVESIQDIVEDTLIRHNFSLTAKKYIKYRLMRSLERV